jgi:hypothetical protein
MAEPAADQVPDRDLGSGWRLPALAVLTGLAVVVGLARMGMPSPPPPIESPLQLAPVVVEPTPTASPPPVAILTLTPSEFAQVRSPWPDRYADGIPRSIDGVPVHRFNAAQASSTTFLSETTSMLIGGWYLGPSDVVRGCARPANSFSCPSGRFADNPAELAGGQGIRVGGHVPSGNGALVIRGTVGLSCTPGGVRLPAACRTRINAEAVVWEGDERTRSDPIKVALLLSRLADSVSEFHPLPYHDLPECRLARPAQEWVSATGNVTMAFIFTSSDERTAMETEVLNGPPHGDPASGCAVLEPLDGTDGWVSQANVLLRVRDLAGASGDAVRQILEDLDGLPQDGS